MQAPHVGMAPLHWPWHSLTKVAENPLRQYWQTLKGPFGLGVVVIPRTSKSKEALYNEEKTDKYNIYLSMT